MSRSRKLILASGAWLFTLISGILIAYFENQISGSIFIFAVYYLKQAEVLIAAGGLYAILAILFLVTWR